MSNRSTQPALSNFDKLPNSAHVRIDVVKMITGYSAPSIWRRSAKKEDPFPKPKKMGPKNTAWNVGELRKFVAGCDA
ncbi:MAG: AlpA family phage regulatory protein [Burkholderiaceae bacterium]|nr:AlpA family phage regulatory protein [Burkholderiaceae bacterium]